MPSSRSGSSSASGIRSTRRRSMLPWLIQSWFWNWIQAAPHRLRKGNSRRGPFAASSLRLTSRTLTGLVAGSSRRRTPARPWSSPRLRKKRVYAAPTIGSTCPSASGRRSFQVPSAVRQRRANSGTCVRPSAYPVLTPSG